MNLSLRNRKVALSRWRKISLEENKTLRDDEKTLIMKSALCGFLAGDGSLQIRKEKNFYHYQLDFFPDNETMLKTYLNFIKKVYGKKPSVSFRDNVYVARLSSKFVVLDLLKESKFGIYEWSFPHRLFKNKGAKESWLKAFFSAEGYVGNKVIKIQSVNIKSLKKVLKLLLDFKIKGNYYEYKPKSRNHSKVGMIFINSKESRINYFKLIGFWHSKKENNLRKALDL